MIVGWLEEGRTDRWILLDPIYPWMALHHGRSVLRRWADGQNRERALEHTAGPRRMPWPVRSSVKDSGSVVFNVWPVEPHCRPRSWSPGDRVWRDALAEEPAHARDDAQ